MRRTAPFFVLLAATACACSGGDGGGDVVSDPTDTTGGEEAIQTADTELPPEPTLTEFAQVVPSVGLPREVAVQNAANNLDIAWHDGRLFLAFRTAPTHFASPETMLYVVSTTDEQSWRFEGSFSMQTDLREPRLLPLGGALFLYFAVLGDSVLDFAPKGSKVTEYVGPGEWTEPEDVFEQGFIPWRAKVAGDVGWIIGYAGGENIYDFDGEPVQVSWLRTEDGRSFEPAFGGDAVVLEGGASETDLAMLADGTIIAVSRNEAGDSSGFGSTICRGEPQAPSEWVCVNDPRKYDSPLVFSHGDEVWLLARRNLTETGNYDLGVAGLPLEERAQDYQIAYWNEPKRCSLWHVNRHSLEVEHVLDLPSRGDTCFPGRVDLPDGRHLVYNYSNDVDGPDLPWNRGQFRQTRIYRQVLSLP